MRTPQNLGEGLSSWGQAIAYRRLMNQADAGDAAGRAAYDEKRGSVLGALMGGALGGSAPAFNPSPSMPVTANPAGLDPSIIAAVDRVNPQGGYDFTGISAPAQSAFTALSDAWGKPLKINSGYRDPAHNAKVGGAKGSQHVHGNAFDVDVSGYSEAERMALIEKAKAAGFRGIGVYDNALHFDVGPERAWGADYTRGSLPPQYADVVAGGPQGGQVNPGASIPAIMEIMADPYAPQGDKMILGMLLEQQLAQMQPPDPMQALDMEYKRAQIEQMRAPQMAGPPQVETFYDEATGQQYKAQWNGQEWVPVGGVQAADGPLVEVNTGGGKFEEAFAKGDADTVATVYNSGLAATRNLGRIDQLESLLNASPTGAGAALAQIAGEWGINTEGLDQIQAAQAVINSLVPEQRQPGSGPMSDADLALFKQSLPRIINQPGGNQTIVNTMRGIAQYDAEGAAIVQRLRSGEIDRPTAFKLLQDRKNPLAGMKVPAAAKAEPGDLTPEERQYLGIP
jgi:hypothetical protein